MQRFSAILFLSIFLFNFCGYRILIDYWEKEDTSKFEHALYSGVDESELISIKTASSLPPYTENLSEYEWVNGEININGTIYQYVKRKIAHDSIEYLCVPHLAKMKYESAREQFFKLCNDLQENSHQKKNTNSSHLKLAAFEYHSFPASFDILKAPDNILTTFTINHIIKLAKKSRNIDHPPETNHLI